MSVCNEIEGKGESRFSYFNMRSEFIFDNKRLLYYHLKNEKQTKKHNKRYEV